MDHDSCIIDSKYSASFLCLFLMDRGLACQYFGRHNNLNRLLFICSNLILSKFNETLPSQIPGLAALKDSLLKLFLEVHSQQKQVEASEGIK